MKNLRTIAAVLLIGFSIRSYAQLPTEGLRNAVEICPIAFLFDIWAVQYTRQLNPKNELIAGVAYVNINYKDGRSHAPTLILGYRRYLWKNLHAEYQLWPAYNKYYERSEQQFYSGLEVWNEFRVGYTFNFRIGSLPFYVNPQMLAGFGIHPGNKPESFMEQARKEPLFVAPVVFVGYRF